MTCNLMPLHLTDEQRGQIGAILSVGCDRQTAADYVGCSLADIRRAMRHDSAFSADVRRSEASVELMHMRNVQELAKQKKEWRASVWWLERHSPERFARRAGVVTPRQLKAIIPILNDIFLDEIHDAADRTRVTARFNRVVDALDQILRDSQPEWLDENNPESGAPHDDATLPHDEPDDSDLP